MFDIARLSIERPLYVWLLIAFCFFGGWWGFETVGRLEDPPFPIKIAFVVTPYPGASALEVEQEVTEVVETALQQLPYVEKITSKSVPGRSEVQVEMHERFSEQDVRQIWDEMRRRVGEAAQQLPPGAGTPHVEDDYGDVYGVLYAITAPGYSIADRYDMARAMTTGLKRVPGVARVSVTGLPVEAVFIELRQERLTRLGLPLEAVFAAIANENRINAAGSIRHGPRRLRIAPEQAFDSLDDIRDMRVGLSGTTQILRLGDIAEVSRGPIDNQPHLIRHQHQEAFSLGVSITDGENVVEVGKAIDARLAQLLQQLPLGAEAQRIYAQHAAVEAAISEFMKNLMLSVATVFAALFIFMGWRAGVVVGSVLLLTVMGSIGLMSLLGIELQRISLGALMIAMGMLVDNAIVVAEGMLVGVGSGLSKVRAATRAVQRTQWPLLGATVIGILAFAPIGLSDDQSGHFLRALFQVVCIALLLSWLLAITVVPMLGSRLLVQQTNHDEHYGGWMYQPYRVLLGLGLRHAWLATALIIGIIAACFSMGQFLKSGFFPTTNTPMIFVDLNFVQGTDIHATRDEALRVESIVAELSGVEAISTFIGRGEPRYAATVRPEQPNPAYALVIVRMQTVEMLPQAMTDIRARLAAAMPHASYLVRRQEFSPTGSHKIEARFSGPDPVQLRRLSERAADVFLQHGLLDRSQDWREPELELVPRFDATRARISGITRADVAQSLAYTTDGVNAGLFRDADKVIPIVMRAPERERANLASLPGRLVWSPAEQTYVPMSTVVSGFDAVATENLIRRRDRERTMTALANPPWVTTPPRCSIGCAGISKQFPCPQAIGSNGAASTKAARPPTACCSARCPLPSGPCLSSRCSCSVACVRPS